MISGVDESTDLEMITNFSHCQMNTIIMGKSQVLDCKILAYHKSKSTGKLFSAAKECTSRSVQLKLNLEIFVFYPSFFLRLIGYILRVFFFTFF